MAINIGSGVTIRGGTWGTSDISVNPNIAPAIGTYWTAQGGYYAGAIQWPNGTIYELVIADRGTRPSQSGYSSGTTQWSTTATSLSVSAATAIVYSYDGSAATTAYAAAGFVGATGIKNYNINGFTDWYVPSILELFEVYRNLKPTTYNNSTTSVVGYTYSSIGLTQNNMNPRAVGGTFTGTSTNPAQTSVAIFQSGGAEALAGAPYGSYIWSSTPTMFQASDTVDDPNSIMSLVFDWQGIGGGGTTTGFYQTATKTNGYHRIPMRRVLRA